MKKLRSLVRQQRRTLFVLMAIAACFLVNAAWRADWPQILDNVGFGEGVEQEQGIGILEKSPPLPYDEDALPRKEIVPDYRLPVTTDGSVPVISRVPTEKKVVFLTLDDGMTRTPDAPRLLAKYHIQAPMFLNDEYVQEKPLYFQKLVKQGMVAGSHTVDHADLTTLGHEQQVAEICDNAAHLKQWLGERPTLFRPPYGSYDDNVGRAAGECGMRAVVMWSAKANGGSMQYQDGHTGLVPGDIVLMHFRPEFAKDFQAFIDAAKAAGLQPENLDEWLRPPKPLPNSTNI